ncbi:hypothetical protein BC832DRAFT_529480 [Gaertneriomyces semiglobifer]|nr:hypothetical protein BC832DRAFT_529480 [Gaertneriomyces semiglobifer]
MPPKQKISKASISSPTPLLSPEQAQAAANLPSVVPYTSYSAYASGESSGSISVDGIDGKGSLGISGYGGLVGDSAKTGRPAILPFSPGRFDSSASVAGGPNDPKLIRARLPPPKLTMRQYQSFVQALGSYRRQVQALAAASETFVRTLEEISDFVPAAKINKPHVVGDLDFLIDSTHLIANAHQGWAETLEREFETPLINDIKDIMEMTARRRDENKVKINELVEQLHKEEDRSYKLGKKKQRDIKALQESLNIRMSIADEIKRRTVENQTLHDTLSHQHMEYILENCAVGVRAELENYETIFEGLKKVQRPWPLTVQSIRLNVFIIAGCILR